jgi:ADP-heptose:LPS heptosyltransferase
VRGKHLALLAEKLKQAGIEQVISYGQALHVSSKSEQKINELVKQYSQEYQWLPTKTSLEDVFISLVAPDEVGERL